jgi:hypothetical protein
MLAVLTNLLIKPEILRREKVKIVKEEKERFKLDEIIG